MFKNFTLIVIFIFSVLFSSFVISGPYQDNLSKCIVEKTTKEEKNLLMKWMFVVISEHPAIPEDYKISNADKALSDIDMANIVMNIFQTHCSTEGKQAMQYEGESSIAESFRLLGEVAMRNFLMNAEVNYAAGRFTDYIDEEEFISIFE